MIKNYLIIAIRNIQRNLSYSVINVFGLALGITSSLVLFLMIIFFTSFDNFHENGDRIYRVVTSSDHNGREGFGPGIPVPLADAVRNDITGIEHVLFISGSNTGMFTIEENVDRKIFEEEDGFGFTDSTYFTFFNRHLLAGNYKTALSECWATALGHSGRSAMGSRSRRPSSSSSGCVRRRRPMPSSSSKSRGCWRSSLTARPPFTS